MDKNKEKSEYNKYKKYDEQIQDLKESYKLGKKYYKNVENKIKDYN